MANISIPAFINVFFFTSAFFAFLSAGLFSCSRLLGTQGVRPDTTAQAWALVEVRGTFSWGSKSENWQVTTGRHSEHVEPSRPMQTHVRVEKMSDELRMSFRIPLTARTDCLPTSCSCSCSSAPRSHSRVVVLVLECCCARARVLIFQRVGRGKYMYSKHIFIFIYRRERCLHFRPLVDRGQYFLLNSKPCCT